MRMTLYACGVLVAAIALSACDSPAISHVGTAPSPIPAISASIQYVPTGQGPGLGTAGCHTPLSPLTTFDVVIATSAQMRVDNVTMQLIDGSNLGGPMVTFPQPRLMSQFGTTVVPAGIARTFTFTPQFACGSGTTLPSRVMGQITLSDSTGLSRTVAISAPLP